MTNDLGDTIDILDRLIGFQTISSESNAECIAWIQEYLENLGATCTVSSAAVGKTNLFATLGPDVDGGIILSGHTDVVPVAGQNWSHDPFTMRESMGRLYGRGACDMKGFIAASLVCAKHYAKLDLQKPIHFAFTYDEEVGCLGARVLIDQLVKSGLKPSVCIVGEPTSMRIIEGHKGCCEYTTQFTGVEGHSSQPDLCVNALEYATRFVSKLMDVRANLPAMAPKNSPFDPPHSTSSICEFHSGVAHNVVPNTATVGWEMRVVQKSDHTYLRGEMQRFVDDVLRPEMQAKSPTSDIAETFASEVDGLEPEPDSAAVKIVQELTGGNSTDVVAFGTEAGLFQQNGISTVICGPGSIEQAHKPDEYVDLSQLDACLAMLKRLGDKLV
ncbi:acetylornithine deacetylase [Amylibacter ulvae]|uniref:Acetylornithine deacetylase n=1 Tax=Paramylibacter ulvae TaxID=1651968 RepID=A0ABQ3D289_9RHOB|nr:acetylornithine deacetylase [Amylibacter ulvae]GHA53982.1 acetylornithine deacetylase [Amylibacter ulvae]